MSTSYHLEKPKTRITNKRLWDWCRKGKISLLCNKDQTPHLLMADDRVVPVRKLETLEKLKSVCLRLGRDHVWFYRYKTKTWSNFTRYGINNPDRIVELIENETGGTVLSEYKWD